MPLSAILLVTTGQLLDSDSIRVDFDDIVLGRNDTLILGFYVNKAILFICANTGFPGSRQSSSADLRVMWARMGTSVAISRTVTWASPSVVIASTVTGELQESQQYCAADLHEFRIRQNPAFCGNSAGIAHSSAGRRG